MPRVIPPTPNEDDTFFWDAVAQGRLALRKCAGCDHLQHPPQPMCQHCHSTQWSEHEAAGTGTVISYFLSRHPSEPDAQPRIVVLVELTEGVRMVSNFSGAEHELAVPDLPVEVHFATIDGVSLPQFRAR